MLQELSVILGIAAGIIQLFGYWYYNLYSGHKINTGSWSIWAIGGTIDLVSYFAITHDWVVNLLPAACAAAAIATFLYAVVKRRFSPLERLDYAFLSLDGLITIIWFFTNAVTANLLYQISTALSFAPMVRGLVTGKDTETPMPWLIWTIAYCLLTLSVLLRLQRWEELAFPVSHLIAHLTVAILAFRMRGPYATA